ncbi:hypothetical protein BX616_007630, partial [Lobosporangium transversale]
MDVYSLTKKQRPTHLTRAQVDKPATMAPSAQQPQQQQQQQQQQQKQQHSQLPPEYRQALLEQQQQQQTVLGAPPTMQDIANKHSQLPPQYRQAVLEQQQKEHQQRMLQQQQKQQSPSQSPRVDAQSHSVNGVKGTNGTVHNKGATENSSPQKNFSGPLTSSYRSERSNSFYGTTSGPSRAHWKPDSSTQVCTWPGCHLEFGFFDRRHHCRKCGDIFCSAHCSKSVPLDYALDFNPAMGVMSRACIGCFEAYEQWQGLIPSSPSSGGFANTARGIFGLTFDNIGEYPKNGATSTTTTTTTTTTTNNATTATGGNNTNGKKGPNTDATLGETMGRD